MARECLINIFKVGFNSHPEYVINGKYDPTGGDGFVRGEWREVEKALIAGIITDEEYEQLARDESGSDLNEVLNRKGLRR